LNGTKLSQIAFAVAQTTDKALLEKVIHQATGGNPSNSGSGMVSAVTSSVTTASATAVDGRMASLQTAYADGLSGREVAGVNAGSSMMTSGNVWTKVGGTSGTQRMYEGSTGFRSSGYHGIIGADAQVTDRISAGLALSYADTTVKHHDVDTGNKTDVASTHFMLYATGQVTDAIYVTGQLGGGKHQLKARRDLSALKTADSTLDVGTGMARATYDITDMQAKLETGYRFAFPTYGASLTPYVAVSFNDSESDKYKERDGGILNREVASRRDDSIAGIVGFRSRVDVHEQASMEVRGAWKQDFKKKRSKIDFNFADEASIRFTNEGARPVRSAVMMGAGVTTQVAPDMDLTVDYDAELRRRYVGHTGSLKLKFKF
jgi:outer membrane autotransporter protein